MSMRLVVRLDANGPSVRNALASIMILSGRASRIQPPVELSRGRGFPVLVLGCQTRKPFVWGGPRQLARSSEESL